MNREQRIDLDKKQLGLLKKILKRQIPNNTVWAYGSRVTWKANEISDLDLAVFECNSTQLSNLKEELEESDLLISVDVMDWESIPEKFKENIKKKYVVLQEKTKLGGWREVKLGEVGKIVTGKTPSEKNPGDWGNEMLFITPSDYKNYRKIAYSTERKLSSEGVSKLMNKILPPHSIMVTCIGSGMGKVAVNKFPAITNQQINSIVPNANIVSPDFLYNFLVNIYDLLRVYGTAGTAVPILNKGDFEKISISLPLLPAQKAIAEVLSSLDDKIDLLHRQNKTLENIAQTLFRQWFVEDAKADWEERPLDKMADYLNGLACQKHPAKNEIDKLPVLKIKELRNGCTENSDWATSEIEEKYIIEIGDIIFSWSGSLMLKIWDGQKCVLNQHLFKVTSEQYPKWFYYFWTKHYLEKFIGIADSKATTMGHIKRGDLSSSMVLTPADNTLKKMSKKIMPVFEKNIWNIKQIRTLENLRDALLPKLMSGTVMVKSF